MSYNNGQTYLRTCLALKLSLYATEVRISLTCTTGQVILTLQQTLGSYLQLLEVVKLSQNKCNKPHHMQHIWVLMFLRGAFHRKSFHPCSSKSNPPTTLCKHNRQSKKHANWSFDQLWEQKLPWILGKHDPRTTRKRNR